MFLGAGSIALFRMAESDPTLRLEPSEPQYLGPLAQRVSARDGASFFEESVKKLAVSGITVYRCPS
jgi:hypothetical protein